MLPEAIGKALYGFMASEVLYVCVEKGIFEYLCKHPGSSAENISSQLTLNSDAVERLLILAEANDLLGSEHGNYRIPSSLRQYFDADSSNYCGDTVRHFITSTKPLFSYLSQTIVDGKAAWLNETSDEASVSPFDEIYKTPESVKRFVSAMWNIGYKPAKELVEQFDFDKYEHLVDLGGASGSFSIAVLERHANMKATVFDLPPVGPSLKERAVKHRVDKRLSFIPGDFFKDVLPPGDIYSYGYILSDWDREQCTYLLKKSYEALPENGVLIVLEKLFNDDKKGPYSTANMNLSMMLETNGKHYSSNEYDKWLKEIGFKSVDIYRSSYDKHMIVAKK